MNTSRRIVTLMLLTLIALVSAGAWWALGSVDAQQPLVPQAQAPARVTLQATLRGWRGSWQATSRSWQGSRNPGVSAYVWGAGFGQGSAYLSASLMTYQPRGVPPGRARLPVNPARVAVLPGQGGHFATLIFIPTRLRPVNFHPLVIQLRATSSWYGTRSATTPITARLPGQQNQPTHW